MDLRDYQRDCLQTIWQRYQAGVRRQLVCLPTGTGKTVIFAQLPTFLRMKKRMLILAHREELLEQAAKKLHDANPALRVGIEQGDRRAAASDDVVVASVGTLGRRDGKRLLGLDAEQFSVIVVDEAHHAAADSWRRTLEHFGVFAPDTTKLLVGFTATPTRMDGHRLDEVFQEIVFERDLPTMIGEGFLTPIGAYRVETDTDLSAVRSHNGDFSVAQLAGVVNTPERNDLIVKVQRERLGDKKTLCFCVDVEHAHAVAAAFRSSDIPAAALHGEMPAEERRRTLEEFREGRLRVLTNCLVLTEGYDEPSIEGIVLARPTKSPALYTQMVGRGTRLHPGKSELTVIDLVDVSRKHSLVTLPSLFGLSSFDLEGATTTELDELLRYIERERPWVQVDDARSMSELQHRCTRIDLFGLKTPRELGQTKLAWLRVGTNSYRLPIGGGQVLSINRTLLGDWSATLRLAGGQGVMLHIVSDRKLPVAARAAEAWLERERPGAVSLASRTSRWRRSPPSEKQIRLLRRQQLEIPPGITRGDASRVIGMMLVRRRADEPPAQLSLC